MPRIFDNIDLSLFPALIHTLGISERADFCVGYFNLRGWKHLDCKIDQWAGGDGRCCRLLVGMQKAPAEEFRAAMSMANGSDGMDTQTALRLKKKLAEEFRSQLMVGIPTNEDEAALRRLACQIKEQKVVVRLFLRHHLHAKLYLMFRPDPNAPIIGYLGSSNLTLAGLAYQGELNVDVLDSDATEKLARWFEDRWTDKWCIDISAELVQIIEESWARPEPIPPYHIYIKMAYHLSQEARAGLSEFRIPTIFGDKLFEYQSAAVKIAARHLHKRGGVLVGDVVGLGKTLVGTALARIFEDDFGMETLILCPKNLVKMWEDYRAQYGLRGRVLSVTRARKELGDLKRYKLVLLDESHNFRNRDGKTYRAIREYIEKNDSNCILLSATPYNNSYLDLSNQLRLFVPEEKDLGIRPEHLIREIGETEFGRIHQGSPRSLAAFERSPIADDWRELMRLYMVRRTRSFIQENYAASDCSECGGAIPASQLTCPDCGNKRTGKERRYLTFENGNRSYFPTRVPKTVKFKVDEQYARLFAPDVVDTINDLCLPRYGLGNYSAPRPDDPPSPQEAKALDDLSRAGKRLMGFCRTGLFKRLESSGYSFLLSVERHILRNFIYLHAIENGLPLPIGAQGAELLDSSTTDQDAEETIPAEDEGAEENKAEAGIEGVPLRTEAAFRKRATDVYAQYAGQYRSRFRWLRPTLFNGNLPRGSWLLGEGNLREPTRLAAKLRDAKDPLSAVLKDSLRSETRRMLDGYVQSHPPNEILRKALIEDLNQVILGGSLYSTAHFKGIALSNEVRILLTQAVSGGELARLNRLLLEAAYPGTFTTLAHDLWLDARALLSILEKCGKWEPEKDGKLAAVMSLLRKSHSTDKVLLFTQFADTAKYVGDQIAVSGLTGAAVATGQSADPTELAWRFSPESNNKRAHVRPQDELRCLVATDVLSEGQNLQDSHIVVNLDLPWALVRLIQRAGRVDRIGQKAERILCYSFLPADGVEQIIKLRKRVRQRLKENAEVVGSDEAFFEDDKTDGTVLDLYHEKAGVLDDVDDGEVDLASYAYQVWKNAITNDPSLQKTITEMPAVVYSTRAHQATRERPEGVLLYMQTGEGNDALTWMDKNGNSVTESQYAVLRAAACGLGASPVERLERHHELVRMGVEHIVREERSVGGQLGRPSGARFRTYERLQRFASNVKGTLFEMPELLKAIDEIYKYPLTQAATDRLNAHLRADVSDEMLAQLVILLRNENRLSIVTEDQADLEPRIICSMGLSVQVGS